MSYSIKDVMYRAKSYLFLMLFFSMLIACSDDKIKSTIRVSIIPDTNKEEIAKRYTPLLTYLTEKTGIHFHLIYSGSYKEHSNKFLKREVDLAYFGGYTYVNAHKNVQAEPMVFRDTDERFNSVVLVKKSNPAKTLSDLKNTNFSFGSELSTSGHLMPRYFFSSQNIKPETFFKKIIYSGSHSKTAELVASGEVNAGVANAEIINRMLKDGRLSKQTVRILWTSPPYPDYVWAIQSNINNETKNAIKDAFLSLNYENKEDAAILTNIGAKYFLPATHENFIVLEDTIHKLNLLK